MVIFSHAKASACSHPRRAASRCPEGLAAGLGPCGGDIWETAGPPAPAFGARPTTRGRGQTETPQAKSKAKIRWRAPIVRLSELPGDREIVAYCRGPYCILAVEAVEMLQARGFRAVRLDMGVVDWRARGFEVVVGG